LKVGFIGIGRMGTPMAHHVLAAGHLLKVCDVRPDAVTPLEKAGASVAATPAEAATDVDIVVASLPGPEEVELVMTGPDGVLTRAGPGLLIADTSTVSATLSRRLADAFEAEGARYLDWPITGGHEGAVSATLSMMVGGDKAAYERALPVMRSFGSNIHYMGQSGAGSGMKLIIQLIFLTQLVTFFEGLALGDRLGINLDSMLEMIKSSAARHPTIEKRYDKIKANDLTPRFELRLVLKDLTLASGLLTELGGRPLVTEGALATLARAIELGHGDHDAVALRTANRT
jgi:3-hydroxyisobutyrate dehydrogenase-like beta-hydroxyacid dehydrogenase